MVSDTLMTQKQVTALARANGFSEKASVYAGAIAMTETLTFVSGKQYADFDLVGDERLADDMWGFSYSGWQIRSLRADKGTGRTRDEDQLKTDPAFAARSAFTIYKNAGYSFRPWSTFNSGAYLGFMGADPIAAVPDGSYRVTGGDSLSKIGNKQGYKWGDIATVNRIKPPYTIYPGQVLLMPDFPHVVVRGETLTSIATKYGTNLTADRLGAYNKLTDTKLSVGQTITIPRL